MRLAGFIGPSSRQRSRNINDERTINWFLEQRDAGTPAVSMAFVPTPGVQPWAALGAGPVRALFAQRDRVFGVGGAGLYEIFGNRTSTLRGTMALDGNPATITSNGTNGHQLFITSGGHGYIFDLNANTLTEITDDAFPVPVLMGAFVDSYFLALKKGSNQFNWSALLDGISWNGLDVAQTSLSADPKSALGVSHRNVFVLGEEFSEVWSTVGGTQVFAPNNGTLIEHGVEAPFTVINLDNTLYWVGRDEGGHGVVWRINGYTPERVSTHAVEFALSQSQHLASALAYTYQEQGHGFYLLYVPDLETTWVYDVTTQQWHERAIWDTKLERWTPHISRCHAFGFGRHLMGSRTNRVVYEQRTDLYQDILAPAA